MLPQGGTVQLWDIQQQPGNKAISQGDNVPIGIFGQADENFIAIAYGPDNQQIAALNADGRVELWPIFKNTQDLITFIRDEIKPSPLSDEQRCQYGLLAEKVCSAAK